MSALSITLDVPSTRVVFGTLRLDVFKTLTGKTVRDTLGKVWRSGPEVISTDPPTERFMVRLDEGDGVELPVIGTITNEAGRLILLAPPSLVGTIDRVLGQGVTTASGIVRYQFPERKQVEVTTPLGPVRITAEPVN